MSDLTLDLFFCVAWFTTVIFFMYVILKFITKRFHVPSAWIWAITPVNLVWLAISMLLANGVFFVIEKIVGFKFL